MKFYTENIKLKLKNKIKKIYKQALKETHNKVEIEVNLILTDEENIKYLNSTFREVDKVTDVLSFPAIDVLPEQGLVEFQQGKKPVFIGDIAICESVAKKQALEFGHSDEREICFLALHGFLHLLGYDHQNKKQESQMKELAYLILEKCKIRRENV